MHLSSEMELPRGVIGGLILGTSASVFLYLSGKITGLSGISENLLKADGEGWNVSYMVGLGSAGALLSYVYPHAYGAPSDLSIPTIIAAGTLVGFGTRLSGGCTSGHGLCGLARFSPRSLTAVLTFMATGAITAYITSLDGVHQMLILEPSFLPHTPLVHYLPTAAVLVGSFIRNQLTKSHLQPKPSSWTLHAAAFGNALLFGLGLGISGMCDPSRVINFLNFTGKEGWDLTLAAVLCSGLAITSTTFPWLQKQRMVPVCGEQCISKSVKIGTVPENMKIDWKLLVGSAIFGVGWGLGGICPGPGIVAFGGGLWSASIYVPSLLLGMLIKDLLV